MYLGIDLGTSGVKVILLAEDGQVIASQTAPLSVSRPHPLWSEQDPESWWQATDKAMLALAAQHDLKAVKAIGLSGQMHGATLLDKQHQALRPAMLWNDGRAFQACQQLQLQCPEVQAITGNLVMPGFTAPKLLWVKENEPETFQRIAKVLLPKDYLRWRMSGDFATDVSDASGTLWLDMEERAWSERMLQATGLTMAQMPRVYEGSEITGELSAAVAKRWSLPCVPIAAGGGDNAAGAVGMGVIHKEETMLSLGTSGVIFSVSDGFTANPDAALHSFGHALPNTWHTMSVILSAASCVDWVVRLTRFSSVAEAFQALEKQPKKSQFEPYCKVVFLPYLSGERTPHNDPNAKGVFYGLSHDTQPLDLFRAVLEGVSFALLDGLDAVKSVQQVSDSIDVIGGGARSHYWLQLLANVLAVPMDYREGGEVGPSLGAARLAALAVQGASGLEDICRKPNRIARFEADLTYQDYYQEKRQQYQSLYQRVKGL
ncbi:xylulokinase [Marinomonas pollencensis]|uniref:Xylulose kinase n=1 Tax=Marinomonas pollencensis TaxID=491954 RepID=A0A3E0DX91_9GAMM|nr:xylulokinase [Marinomonas pollencensis]REG86711.1 xylulokinase [Marinomonas pollencensis]